MVQSSTDAVESTPATGVPGKLLLLNIKMESACDEESKMVTFSHATQPLASVTQTEYVPTHNAFGFTNAPPPLH